MPDDSLETTADQKNSRGESRDSKRIAGPSEFVISRSGGPLDLSSAHEKSDGIASLFSTDVLDEQQNLLFHDANIDLGITVLSQVAFDGCYSSKPDFTVEDLDDL